ncbi:uncharacterized protein N7496_009151 [Penicillium cataractarum]|uniref:Uncharacterized protein n=1 Tax=Penicillium cataractarum TaxID=2100454 RepID=A0A9W9RNF9_9EURO|nr:uncharacterized protein N7496_009151 [Penicillium cataractarum]KAJ5363438.1 hypothetical protein N7496_009151 [Penicillium cataractarum]
MQVMNSITDKPDWDKKVFDEEITSKWREEISHSGEDVSPKMMDWIIKELQWKSESFKETGRVMVFDVGVVKSDTAISTELQQALKEAVIPFEDVPEDQKDYHPGSNQQVIDLVHPSLCPVIFGRSRILPDRTIDLETCLGSVGQGELLPVPSKDEVLLPPRDYGYGSAPNSYSEKFQWLPCDVEFTEDDGCRIVSYINNAHPVKHRGLYEVVDKVITQVVPLWNQTLAFRPHGERRIHYSSVDYEDTGAIEPEQESDEDDDAYEERYQAFQSSQRIIQPDPEEFQPPKLDNWSLIDLRKEFSKEGLQVIVKLANIELTPEKPEYAGGSWHIEGQLNERICATAIYYYDSENITESTLAFRQRSEDNFEDAGYEQDRHEFLQAVYGFGPEVSSRDDTNVTQTLGSVVCREGRLLTFPNVVQHCVSPFSLEDRTKPGHRKILALFLIDPHRRIISSANVPPQQEDWGKERQSLVNNLLAQNLPPELQNMVEKDMPASFITMKEAKDYRLELMAERSVRAEVNNSAFEIGSFSLCEH